MSSTRERMPGARWILVALLLPFAVFADDALDAVEGQASRIADATDAATEGRAVDAERTAIEPGVSADTLAAAAARSQRDSQVMDRMELERSEITGNQELPKVLYIVPWRKAEPSDLMGRPVNTLLDEVLAPIDREEFVRAVGYYEDLYDDDDE